MASAMAISQAGGTAAGLCVASACRPADFPGADLQTQLEGDGGVIRVPVREREHPRSE
jgi:hypothetical protein